MDNLRCLKFLKLLEIMDFLFAPVLSNDHISYLHYLIEDHHLSFHDLYPHCNITPKFHYLVHYPRWINRYNKLIIIGCPKVQHKHQEGRFSWVDS